MSFLQTRSIDHSRISRYVTVHGPNPRLRSRRDAACFIDLGYRVTDHHGFDLKIETHDDGTRRVVRGGDDLGCFYDRERLATDARAQDTDEAGRPKGILARELTDYEASREHPNDCGIPNCDHPVHFGGPSTGELSFEKALKKPNDDERKVGSVEGVGDGR